MATINIPNFLTEKVVDGLNSYTYTIQSAGVHNCRIIVDHRNASTMQVAISQSGSVSAVVGIITLTAVPEGGPQNTVILQGTANCAVGDVITFVLSSTTPDDLGLNTMKARLNVHLGGLN